MLNQYQNSLVKFNLINQSALFDKKPELFYDNIHVNKKGRVLATQEFVKMISKKELF
jgi:hypothetical protein